MAGTRRGTTGSGRPTKAAVGPTIRLATYRDRLARARNDRDRASAALQYLRAVMADPHIPPAASADAAIKARRYLETLAQELEKTADNGREGTTR